MAQFGKNETSTMFFLKKPFLVNFIIINNETIVTILQIDRRIFSFIERKRYEVNQLNLREFCGILDPSIELGK